VSLPRNGVAFTEVRPVAEQELKRMARLVEINRQRLEQINDQISRLEIVQAEHADVETTLAGISQSNAPVNAMLPLGAGVHFSTTFNSEATAVIDIGSGVFAEKNVGDAAENIRIRIADLGKVIAELSTEAESIESKIAEMSEEFDQIAKRQVAEISEPTASNTEQEESPNEDSKRSRRRFGGELTLDD